MTDMPRPRPPHLYREVTRHDRVVWYVRRGRSARIRIHAIYGTPEFKLEYEAAIAGEPPAKALAVHSASLQWLYDRYRETGAWTGLSSATRRQRENILAGVMATGGREAFAAIRKKDIAAGKDRRHKTPAQARNFLDAMRGLFRWALAADHVTIDPTAGVENPARPSSEGFVMWTEEEIDLYQKRWPIGTNERVWFDVLLYTGLRRGDAVRLGRQHVKDGIATLRTEKSRGSVTVTIPILSVLAATLAAGPCGDLAFICGRARKPLAKETFGNMFRAACNAAGVSKSAHGLRKAGATRAADNGATTHELKAIFGWSSDGMAALYTRKADLARLAKGAMTKLERPIPAPIQKVRAVGENS